MFKTTLALSALALTALGWQQQSSKPTRPAFALPLKEERMTLEHNVTLGEAVVRVEAESEEELDQVQVSKPDGGQLFVLEGGAVRGLSGFVIELRESSLESIRATYAEGTYEMHARTARGKTAVGSADLSLELPAAPRLTYPFEGAVGVPTEGLVVRWRNDRWVSGYRVQLEQGETDGLVVELPAGKHSLQIPDGFLEGDTETQLEIATIGPEGNRTVVEVHFTTE